MEEIRLGHSATPPSAAKTSSLGFTGLHGCMRRLSLCLWEERGGRGRPSLVCHAQTRRRHAALLAGLLLLLLLSLGLQQSACQGRCRLNLWQGAFCSTLQALGLQSTLNTHAATCVGRFPCRQLQTHLPPDDLRVLLCQGPGGAVQMGVQRGGRTHQEPAGNGREGGVATAGAATSSKLQAGPHRGKRSAKGRHRRKR
jgi:hypothetical protein